MKNDMSPRGPALRVHCIHHEKKFLKSDAYLLEYGDRLLLIDSGMKGSLTARDYLLALRRRRIESSGADESVPLRLSWLVSHFHVDHVCAMLESILPDPRFELDTVILPPDSALDPYFNTIGTDGDTKYRPLLAEALGKYGTGRENIINIGFGAENIVSPDIFPGPVKLTVYPPAGDGGIGERLQYMIDGYCDGRGDAGMLPTAAVNACSVWLHVRYGAHSFLFTGDTMKREARLTRENADEMVEMYGERIGQVTVVKYLHHGYRRDPAAPLIMSFRPEHIIVACEHEGASAALHAAFPDMTAQIHNCADRDIIFETDGERLTVGTTASLWS